MPSPLPPILDACCGGRMMYFDKRDPRVLGQDIRTVPRHKVASNGSYFEVRPDHIGDFRHMDFPDEAFSLVVFDPPHLKCGETSFMFHKYGSLGATWENDLRQGFAECFRVLKPCGTLVFKWCDSFKSIDAVLALAPCKPVLSHSVKSRSGSKFTYFVVFIKDAPMHSKTKQSASPRPWSVDDTFILDSHGGVIAAMCEPDYKADAALIVEAVNKVDIFKDAAEKTLEEVYQHAHERDKFRDLVRRLARSMAMFDNLGKPEICLVAEANKAIAESESPKSIAPRSPAP